MYIYRYIYIYTMKFNSWPPFGGIRVDLGSREKPGRNVRKILGVEASQIAGGASLWGALLVGAAKIGARGKMCQKCTSKGV